MEKARHVGFGQVVRPREGGDQGAFYWMTSKGSLETFLLRGEFPFYVITVKRELRVILRFASCHIKCYKVIGIRLHTDINMMIDP